MLKFASKEHFTDQKKGCPEALRLLGTTLVVIAYDMRDRNGVKSTFSAAARRLPSSASAR